MVLHTCDCVSNMIGTYDKMCALYRMLFRLQIEYTCTCTMYIHVYACRIYNNVHGQISACMIDMLLFWSHWMVSLSTCIYVSTFFLYLHINAHTQTLPLSHTYIVYTHNRVVLVYRTSNRNMCMDMSLRNLDTIPAVHFPGTVGPAVIHH